MTVKQKLTRNSITRRIYSVERRDCGLIHADKESQGQQLLRAEVEGVLSGGKAEAERAGLYGRQSSTANRVCPAGSHSDTEYGAPHTVPSVSSLGGRGGSPCHHFNIPDAASARPRTVDTGPGASFAPQAVEGVV